MTIWVHVGDGVIDEPPIQLPDNLTPGKDVFTAEYAESMVDVTGRDPQPGFGWTTSDGGKTFSAPVAPTPVVPASVSSAQAKIQCLRTPGSESGKTLLDDITGKVKAAGGEVQIWFSEARTWERTNPYVEGLSGTLSLTADQVDKLFIAAAQIAA